MLNTNLGRVVVGSLVSLIATGTIIFHALEDWTWIESFYFTVATLSTVGYGDISPTSDSTRLFTAIFIIFGVAIAVTALSVLGESYIENRTENRKKKKK